MKKIIFSCLAAVTILSSCLKDKGFDNHEYGIKDPSGSPKGVSFPLGVNDINTFGLDAASPNLQVVSNAVVVNSETGDNPTTDVNVKLVLDPTLLTQYNADNGTTILPFDPQYYSLSSLNLVIKAGKDRGNIDIKIPSTVPLDLNKSYGIGFRIVSVDNGYTIANNLKSLLLEFNLKNKYDGIYTVTGTFRDVTNATFTANYPREYQVVTTGPNSVDVKQLINGEVVPGYLFLAAGSGSFFGNFGASVIFNNTTNKAIEFRNYYGVQSNPTNGVGTPSSGSGAPAYSATNSRRCLIDPAAPATTNYYDENAKILYLQYIMLQPTSAAGTNPRCFIAEKLVYKKAR
jgi:hypothetical protein